jgi:hypothetical protein
VGATLAIGSSELPEDLEVVLNALPGGKHFMAMSGNIITIKGAKTKER